MRRLLRDARQLQHVVHYRLGSGLYPSGSRLPSTRELAAELGVNRNTVAKMYRELAAQGLLRMVPGRGTFAVGRLPRVAGPELNGRLLELVDAAVAEARLFGLARKDLMGLLQRRLDALYGRTEPQVAFVECNPYDARRASTQLAAEVGVTIQPLLVRALERNIAPLLKTLDVVTTSLYHLEEVSRLFARHPDRIVAIHTSPDPEALIEVARLRPGTKVGVVVSNQAGAIRFAHLVQNYGRYDVTTLATPNRHGISKLAKQVDVLVTSLSTRARVLAAAGDTPVITVAFRVDPQSSDFLKRRIEELTRSAQSLACARKTSLDEKQAATALVDGREQGHSQR